LVSTVVEELLLFTSKAIGFMWKWTVHMHTVIIIIIIIMLYHLIHKRICCR